MSAAMESAPALRKGARAWLEARGLDSSLCERLGMTSRPGRNGSGEIVVPFERNGVAQYAKVCVLNPKTFYAEPAGAEPMFWREDAIRDPALADQPLIITEGQWDAVAAIQAGFWRTVSVPNGAPKRAAGGDVRDARAGMYGYLDAVHADLEPIKEIIIASDGDGPGAALLSDLTALLGPARCKFVSYPAGCKDLNDVLKAHGEDGVAACIASARWVRVAGVHRLFDLPPAAPLTIWRPDVYGPINGILPICPGHVSVWTGIPSHGKSALLNAVMWSIARRYDLRLAVGSFEATPQEYTEDAIAFFNGRPSEECSETEIAKTREWINDRVIFLDADGYSAAGKDDLVDPTLDWFLAAAQTAAIRHGCKIIVLDPWSQLEHARQAGEPDTNYIQRSLRLLRTFARGFGLHCAVVAHPTKMSRLPDGTYSMPEGYDVSGSAHWYNGVHLGVTVHRDPPQKTAPNGDKYPDPNSTRTLIRTWKVKRQRVMGKPGEAYADFDVRSGRYGAPAPTEEELLIAKRQHRKDIYE